jgi:hypothetical protein
MKWLTDILNRRHDTGSARPRPSPLQVEALEDRVVPTLYYHGGPVLDAASVHILYMGNPWYNYTIAGRPAMSSINNAVQAMVTGNYLGQLGEYGVGAGNLIDANLLDAGPFTDVNSGGTLSSPRVEEAINYVYSMGWSQDSGQDLWIVMVGDWTDWSTGHYQAHGHFWSSAANDNVYYTPIYMRTILDGTYGGGGINSTRPRPSSPMKPPKRPPTRCSTAGTATIRRSVRPGPGTPGSTTLLAPAA